MKKMNKMFLSFLILLSSFAVAESIYYVSGTKVGSYNKTKGPKALIKVDNAPKNVFVSLMDSKQEQDTFFVSCQLL